MAIAATEGLAEARAPARQARARASTRGQGRRYSWGYPGLPGPRRTTRWSATCSGAQEAIGIGLTSAYQLDPEQSTAAIVVHHPSAIYFSALRSERASA